MAPLLAAQLRFAKEMFSNVGTGTELETVNFPPNLNISAMDLSFQMLKHAKKRLEKYPGKKNRYQMDA